MRGIDAARERMHVRVLLALRLVETVAAGKDEVGVRDEFPLAKRQSRIRPAKRGKLVHAVIDHRKPSHMPRE